MPIRPIVQLVDPRLRETASPAKDPRLSEVSLGSTSRAITVRYQDPCAQWHEVQASDDQNLSELLQHEIDHLDGILAVDRITDAKTLCTREEF
jgi:peptide deformylase